MSIRRTPTLSTPHEAATAWPWAHCSTDTGPLSIPTRSISLAAEKMPPIAVQETFVLALARLNQLRDADAAGAWLHAILRSVCLMQVRRPRREIATADIEVFAERAEETIGGSPLQDWVFAALEGLRKPLRLATLLRYFRRGHSYAQIALLCDVPVGTVRSRLHQAKAELGKQLLQQTFGRPRAGVE